MRLLDSVDAGFNGCWASRRALNGVKGRLSRHSDGVDVAIVMLVERAETLLDLVFVDKVCSFGHRSWDACSISRVWFGAQLRVSGV